MDEEQGQSHDDQAAEPTQDPSNNRRRRRGRGVALLKALTKKPIGEREKVHYNSKGQPIGSARPKLASYKGLLARTMVKITYESWHKVPRHLKDNMWTAIQAKFDLDPNSKKVTLSDIAKLWKNFKSSLTTQYIRPFRDDPHRLAHVPVLYNKFIEQKEWEEFVRGRLSENFERLSDMQVERRSKNIYNHRLSKRGYAGHAEKLKDELGDAFNEDDRSNMWIIARQDEKGEFLNDATKEMASKITSCKRQIKDGSISIQGTSDILTMALCTPEQGGRVRGVGKGVTPTTYFHLNRTGSKKQIIELEARLQEEQQKLIAEQEKNKIKDQEMQMLKEQLLKFQNGSVDKVGLNISDNKKKAPNFSGSFSSPYKRNNEKSKRYEERQSRPLSTPISNIGKSKGNEERQSRLLSIPTSNIGKSKRNEECQSHPLSNPTSNMGKSKGSEDKQSRPFLTPTSNIGKSKCNEERHNQPLSTPAANIGKGQPCRLALDFIYNIVAAGFVFAKVGPKDKVHNVYLGENNVRVSIDSVYTPNAYLPIPVDNADIITVKDAHGSHVAWPKDFVLLDVEANHKEKNPDCCDERGAIIAFANSIDEILTTDAIEIPIGIFEDNLDTTYIPKNELLRFCNMEELDIICLLTYMKYLYDIFETSREVIKFINPLSVREAFFRKTLNKFITERLKNAKDNQIFFIPFNPGFHWVLVVIDYGANHVYWIDSQHNEPSAEFKLYITTGLRALVVNGKRRPIATFEVIKGPKQHGGTECGFYALRFMRELMEDPSKSLRVKMKELSMKKIYENREINELQHEFIEFIQPYIR